MIVLTTDVLMPTASDELPVYFRRLMNEIRIQIWCALDFCISGDNLEVTDYVISFVPCSRDHWRIFVATMLLCAALYPAVV